MTGDQTKKAELAWLIAFIAIFLAVNLVTATRSPTVWGDEAAYADPAVNAVLGRGFTTTCWPWQPRGERFVGNSPLYSLTLVPWLKMFGVSPLTVRSMNFAVMVVAMVVAWLALRNAWPMAKGWQRLSVVAVFATMNSVTFAYRSARYDAMGIALVCLFLLGVTIEHRLCRLVVMTLAVALMPVTGLQIAMFVTLGAVVVAIAYRPWRRPLAISMAIGLAAGYAVLWATVEALASWQSFQTSIAGTTVAPPGSVATRLARCFFIQPWPTLKTAPSMAASLAAIVVLAWSGRRSRGTVRLAGVAIVGTWLAIAAGTWPRGEFAFYYSCYIELWLLAACVMLLRNVPREWPVRIAVVLMVIAGVVGLPVRTVVTAMEWQRRDYSPVEQFVARAVNKSDNVLCNHQAYYPAVLHSHEIYIRAYFGQLTDTERAAVTVIIASPTEVEPWTALAGGDVEGSIAFHERRVRPQRDGLAVSTSRASQAITKAAAPLRPGRDPLPTIAGSSGESIFLSSKGCRRYRAGRRCRAVRTARCGRD